ncbi:50S ribosomal protein L35 [Candidatus Gottesmanbacteria bacterium CG11_big_fil_rev_8_21_14_0_20_37_11]|uniref:Large ribosomal subunit protein bL35 n=3 Tax=Candidatus Gottesmaniibacteriota TaxID=1752720 RepID=A0A2M7RQ88_9BACT|nr:MAG: hypothetical protein AUJ73_03760 [Candidatus Gottesmanbacteria bacterium CG1_02_37_22]PIP32274.1 MAG: 50S ribosomal protein L35 [Candidatus Gottesmanbacteria bacterium CG23_combo_of_CG06-09_8_20_14_all_37_19]PIR08842.1 MAG: 50S ribosomal protein L35 [Candidatus Gottesmanbacteria bacterium CG11_big_fil_rev_8_21_14_0_20_37_11]PIZ02340.1 MAG: 50S ribosomal protein L35 [Candidatus Gottesmanbacteria bacterium CG_4_10_14_0_8_um_filter_37_24]
MPKQKTRKSILKRVKVTKTGKVLRGHHGAGHRKAHKSKRRIRSFRISVKTTKKQAKMIKRIINKS